MSRARRRFFKGAELAYYFFDRLELKVEIERWALIAPLRIAGHVFTQLDVLMVTARAGGHIGRGEAAGVYYRNETPEQMLGEVEAERSLIESGVSRGGLLDLLPAGGARNAVDCALWDLEAKLTGRPAYEIAGLRNIQPLTTAYTLGADEPGVMADGARGFAQARALKLKLLGDGADASRVHAVRAARPDVWLGVDANQGLNLRLLDHLLPALVHAKVALLEQPFPVGQEALMDGLDLPIPIAADESVQVVGDIAALMDRAQVINIKLDKCGGLTAGLAMAEEARRLGFDVMVGNMMGTGLGMAPAFLLGQMCDIVDLDGAIVLAKDRDPGIDYANGQAFCDSSLWGGR